MLPRSTSHPPPFRFLDLPLELHITIYHSSKSAATTISMSLNPSRYPKQTRAGHASPGSLHCLIRTCSFIRAEATHILYQDITFNIHCRCASKGLGDLARCARHIRHASVTVFPEDRKVQEVEVLKTVMGMLDQGRHLKTLVVWAPMWFSDCCDEFEEQVYAEVMEDKGLPDLRRKIEFGGKIEIKSEGFISRFSTVLEEERMKDRLGKKEE
ncbi:Hypothetical protein D9617_4g002230 [Elsinoe fawcettii]|nr:Hypothetical protein D9617_4g002230 [Elsinoe fawcettii]